MEPKVAFANGTFNPDEFKASEYGQNALGMQKIVLEHRDESMHSDVIAYWESHGAKKELYEAGTNYAWSVFTPIDLDKTKKYPLIYCSHGGGEDYYMAETYGYNYLVQPMQVICVYPENGDFANREIETEFPRILNELEAKGYPIDRSRVYAVGFSAGSVASLRLAMTCPNMLAGIGPVPGANSFRGGILGKKLPTYHETFGIQMPLICCGGLNDGGDAWPLTEASDFTNFNLWMRSAGKISEFSDMSIELAEELKESKDSVKRKFGLNFDETWIDYAEGTFWYCGQYYDDNQVPIARFMGIDGLPHMHCMTQAKEIFSYLRQFSRDLETGELIHTSHNVNHAKNS